MTSSGVVFDAGLSGVGDLRFTLVFRIGFRPAEAIPPLRPDLDGLRFELPDRRVNGSEKVCIGSLPDQFVIVVRHGYFDIIQMPLVRENDTCLGFASAVIEQLPDFCKFCLDLFGLGGRKFDMTSGVSDFHGPYARTRR